MTVHTTGNGFFTFNDTTGVFALVKVPNDPTDFLTDMAQLNGWVLYTVAQHAASWSGSAAEAYNGPAGVMPG
jgi:hypothetical protein